MSLRSLKKPLVLGVFFLFLLVCSSLTYSAEWDSYGKDNSNSFRVGDALGNWYDDAGSPNILSGESPDYQPVIIDITGDADMEIIYPDGNYIRISDHDGLVDELNLGSAITSPVDGLVLTFNDSFTPTTVPTLTSSSSSATDFEINPVDPSNIIS